MEPKDLVYGITRHYLSDLDDVDSALVSMINGYNRSRNYAELSSCSRHFDWQKHTINEWRALRQIEAFFKKNADFAQSELCFENARRSFIDAEQTCSETNIRLHRTIGYPNLIEEGFRASIMKMRRYICNVLGDFSSFINELPSLVRVTPGATSTRSRRDSLPQLKMRLSIYATRRSSKYLSCLYRYFGFDKVRIKAVHTNRVELVPKNWKTHRTIACEPEGNLPLQLAFDSWVKRRLRRFSIDLSDQTANQKLAKRASIKDDLVTVDFSMASDTISFNTVSLLFPNDWFAYLSDVRTPLYRGAFGEGKYAKFSSMGNGATFCIETLIFAAACHALGSKEYSVYGDDVIIEQEYYDDLINLTRYLGFTINREKSFSHGPFRESCGKDYFNGVDVTPVFIRGIDRRKANLCHLCNSLMSIARYGGKLEEFILKFIIQNKLPLVPYNESTLSGIWIDPDMARRRGILRCKNCISTYRAYNASYRRRCFVDSRGYYLWFLNKNSQVLFSGPWGFNFRNISCTETSSVPVFDHTYVRKRVSWFPPATGMPVHILHWTELLVS